jgi:type II secretion system protein J
MKRVRTRGRQGFTLIEVLAVLFLTAIVLGVALNFYVDLSNQSHRASEATREVRRATSLLDRLARDFERTMLVQTPAETDPLDHPWLFLAESRYAEQGSDRVKFVARRAADSRSLEAASDLSMVSYQLYPRAQDGDFEIVRWSQPNLPERLELDFPLAEDPGAMVLADGVSRFELRFLDDTGEWVQQWNSTQLLDESSELPRAVEITVALAHTDPETGDALPSEPYVRRVMLPVRPLDFETLLDPVAYAAAAGEAAGEEECVLKVSDCVDLAALAASAGGAGGAGGAPGAAQGLSALRNLSPEEREAVRLLNSGNLANLCWDNFKAAYADHPMVNPRCR